MATNPPDPMAFQEERYAKGATAYDKRIRKTFPFYDTIHPAINAILRSVLGTESELLIVGAGTGAEILELGTANPNWRFLGVDPAQPMLDLAMEKIETAGMTDRVALFRGYVGDLPTDRHYDGATTAMVLHFVPDDGRKLKILCDVSKRLKSDAPLVVMDVHEDLSAAGTKLLLDAWKHQQNLAGVKWEEVESGMKERVKTIHLVSPRRMEQLLTEAGFHRIQRFFQNMMLGGWIAFKR
jgi:tRNA (cmo5U34)-methyltransferase